jgi:adenine-specific DNA-methyltransferase
MLTAQKERANALTDKNTDYWQRRCDTLDRQIDALVYELYGLTDDEIALVEGVGAEAAV